MIANLPPSFRLLEFERIDSTNDEAKRQANAGAPAFTFIAADEQSSGRGRRGNSWLSPRGNLHCSLLLRPACAPAAAAQLGFAASLAVAEAAERLLPQDAEIACKWPNDVLARGRKFAGILLESQARGGTLEFLVIGIGVNVAAHPADTPTPATSLKALGAEVTPGVLLPILGARLLAWYDAWRGEGFAPLRRAWLARAWGVGRSIRVRLPDGEIEGLFDGLDEAGRLLLGTAGGRRKIAAGEVFPAA
jgi:BirA family transcriptional regulator, biotin operon repressor / biotin---[acetyl-CoA-carboxylase] ligase